MPALSPFDEVIQGLTHHQNALRIKKLLVYACRQIWESDPVRLAHVNLADLIQELLTIAPTAAQLKAHLGRVAQTLSKPDEYALIAHIIFGHLQKLCADHQDTMPVRPNQPDYSKIANFLEQDPEQIRIKKLLFCLCYGSWENDVNRLSQFPLTDLIQYLHRITPSLQSLQGSLTKIVRTLNRQQEYILIANRVVESLQVLYPENRIEHTEILVDSPSLPQPTYPQRSAQATRLQPASPEVPVSPSSPPQQPQLEVQPEAVPLEPKENPYILFDLRLEVMKYTTPLRAKILLYSLLYQAPPREDDNWSALRAYELDDLLQSALQTYPTVVDLEASLTNRAKNLPDTDQYVQAAAAILQALKPVYRKAIAPSFPDKALSTPAQRPPDPAPVPSIPSLPDSDHTCSLLPHAAQADQVDNRDHHTGPLPFPPPPPPPAFRGKPPRRTPPPAAPVQTASEEDNTISLPFPAPSANRRKPANPT